VRLETIKNPKKVSPGSNFSDISHNVFLDMSSHAREAKVKINSWDYIRINSFCTVRETINESKKQPTEWEKIFANDILQMI